MPDIFLSYSREDQPTARRFAEAFEREGFSVWWDQTLRSGENYDQVTEAALRDAKAVVVLWSKHSVDSRWVRAEATTADRAGTLVPAMIEPCNRPIMFELKHTAELTHWKGEANDPAWRSFLSDVRRFVQGESSNPAATLAVPRKSRRVDVRKVAIPLMVLAMAGLVLWIVNRSPDEAVTQEVAVTAPVPAAVTLAVLPFADLSAARDQEYFSDGLTEEILNQLAQIKSLRVTGRTSSFSFKGKNEDLRAIGEKLGVANLLEGSIRKDGEQLRITAQLITASDGSHLWSKTYDRELTKVFALQEEVAKDVAQALSITLDVGELPRALGGTTDVNAYDKYLRAKQLFLRDGRADSIQSARLLREAVALDPQFTLARVWLLKALQLQVERDPDDPAALNREVAATQASILEQAPPFWTAQVRAREQMRRREWAAAEATLKSVEALAPASGATGDYFSALSNFLVSVGRTGEVLPLLQRARELDPLSLAASTDLQAALLASGRWKEAEIEYERSKTLQGDHGRADHFALLGVLAGNGVAAKESRAQFDTFLKTEPLPMALSTRLRDLLGDREAARTAIRDALDDPVNQHYMRLFFIAAYADIYGDRETAIVAMQRSTRLSSQLAPTLYFVWFNFQTDLRTDPRFKEMVREQGLEKYFRTTGKWNDFCRPVGADDFECK